EAGTIGAPGAIMNAGGDALGPLGIVDIDMPATSERVGQAMVKSPKQQKTRRLVPILRTGAVSKTSVKEMCAPPYTQVISRTPTLIVLAFQSTDSAGA